MPGRRTAAALALLALVSAHARADEIDDLVRQFRPPERFAGHVPDFRAEPRTFTFHGPDGPYEQTMHVILDGDRCVALYSSRPQIDLITHDPAQAPKELAMPPRYHNATFFGTRVTTIGWPDKWAVSGDEHGFEFTGGGKTIALTEWQRWKPDGPLGRTGESVHAFTLRLDPVLGYTIDIDCRFVADKLPAERGKPKRGFEFTNLLAGRMVDVWPGRSRCDRTIYCPAEGDKFAASRYAGWASHVVAADRSDNGRDVTVRRGGFVGFIDDGAWSPVLAREGPYRFTLSTCNVWQDQHNHVDFPPEPDADGVYRMNPKFRLAFLPPEVTSHLWREMTLEDFGGMRAVVVRIGRLEDFEDQPLPLTEPVRGAAGHGLRVTTDAAHSGDKSLVVKGSASPDDRGAFLFLPQLNLRARTAYRLEAWIKVEGEGARASVVGDLYEWTPHNPERLVRQETPAVEGGQGWHHVALDFETPDFDPYVDLRFRCVGPGTAYFDDFALTERPKAAAAP